MELIRKIEGKVITNRTATVSYVTSVIGQIGDEDSIQINGFIGCIQNLKHVEDSIGLFNPFNHGLPIQTNKEIITLQIDY